MYQRVIGGEADITSLNQFDNLVFLAVVFQFQVLRIKVKGSIGVVVQVHIHLVTHLTVDTQIHLLIKVE